MEAILLCKVPSFRLYLKVIRPLLYMSLNSHKKETKNGSLCRQLIINSDAASNCELYIQLLHFHLEKEVQ